jgi:hypothetical protein
MSAIGTVIASGVAQATQQASQIANRRDKRVREQQRAAQRTQEVFETHLQTLEDNDETETSARLRTDAQMHTTPQAPNPPGLDVGPVHRRPHETDKASASNTDDAQTDVPQRPAEQSTSESDAAHHGTYDPTGHYHGDEDETDDHPHIDVQG